jgi:flagellar basal-body rod protein FlgC
VNLFGMLGVSGSALTAERQRAEVVTANMANAETTRTQDGGPYQRKMVVFRSQQESAFPRLLNTSLLREVTTSVSVDQVVTDTSPGDKRFEPSHPDADEQGFVSYPNVDPVREMADLMSAVRAYEMNSSAVQATKQMIQQAIEILR